VRGSIVMVAGLLAVIAFVWALVSYSPSDGQFGPFGTRMAPTRGVFSDGPARQAFAKGEYGRVVELSEKMVRANERAADGWYWLAMGQERLGEKELAEEAWRGVLELAEARAETVPSDWMRWWFAGWAKRGLGDEVGSHEAFSHLVEMYETRVKAGQGDHYNLACFRSLAGDYEGAIEAWERAVAKERVDESWARVDPDLEAIRGDARFEAALEKRRTRAQPSVEPMGG
jgi:tetratricopeptide (TPR) repeat protein